MSEANRKAIFEGPEKGAQLKAKLKVEGEAKTKAKPKINAKLKVERRSLKLKRSPKCEVREPNEAPKG